MLHPCKVGGLAKGTKIPKKAAEAKLSTVLYLSTSQATLVLSSTLPVTHLTGVYVRSPCLVSCRHPFCVKSIVRIVQMTSL